MDWGVETDEFLRLFGRAPLAVVAVDRLGRVLDANEAAYRLLVEPGEELLGRNFLYRFSDEDRARETPLAAAMNRGERTYYSLDKTVVRAGRHELAVHQATFAVTGMGTTGRGFLSLVWPTGRDDQSLADALDTADWRYRTVVSVATDVVFETDIEGRFTFLNPAWAELTGIRPAESIGASLFDFLHHPALDTVRAAIADLGSNPRSRYQVEASVIGADGVLRPVRVRLACRPHYDGSIVGFTGVMADLTEQHQQAARLDELMHHDPLTGLANRNVLHEHTAKALRRLDTANEALTIVLVDLDRFKVVNDTLGHQTGDDLLIAMADRLRGIVRAKELVARVGADEFAVVAQGVHDDFDPRVLADRIRAELERPISLGGVDHRVSVSIGAAVASAGTDLDVAQLLADADLALDAARRHGGGRTELYTDDMRARANVRYAVTTELRDAIEHGQLEVYYQPIVELRTGLTRGAEALVRWQHPTRGLVPPGEFIPAAEEAGVIGAVTEFVLRTAVNDWAQCDDGYVSVNASAKELGDPAFPELVAGILERSGFPARRLCLEITETAVLADFSAVESVLHALRHLGVKLAIDDFGTGYSALSYLRRLPVGLVKVDRSWVDRVTVDERDRALVSAIVGMASALDLRLVAEGVETEDQSRMLRELGCELAQGYLFSRPIPRLEFIERYFPAIGSRTASVVPSSPNAH